MSESSDPSNFPALQRAPLGLFWRRISRRLRRIALTPLRRWLIREPEILVKVPTFDDAYCNAIKLIAPDYALAVDESSRRFWERDQNNSCWLEAAALDPLFRAMPKPKRILEIGPGLGRSVIFFSKRFFSSAQFSLYDATGQTTKYELEGQRYADSFCGNLPLLMRTLEFNGVANFQLIDGAHSAGGIPVAAQPFDFVYSFFAVGFHWALDHWLDELLALGGPQTLYVFTVAPNFVPPARLATMPFLLLQANSGLYPETTTYYFAFTKQPTPWFPAS